MSSEGLGCFKPETSETSESRVPASWSWCASVLAILKLRLSAEGYNLLLDLGDSDAALEWLG